VANATALERIAHDAMVAHGLAPDWPDAVGAELSHLPHPQDGAVRDLRALPWSSIDNADSRDLDQVEVAITRARARDC
jgi:exoribonuclease-2